MSTASEASSAGSRWDRVRSFFREELKPQPGRLKGASVRVAGTVLALWVGLALNLPQMGAVLSLAFFGSTRNRTEGKKVAIGVPPTVLVILVLITLFVNLFGAAPLARTIAFVAVIFSSLYLIQAAKTGAIFLMVGIFGKLFLTLWDNGYPAELIQELQLWIVADLAVAGLCTFFVISMFGNPEKDPVAEFRKELASRFDLLARSFADPAGQSETDDDKLREEAFCASDALQPLLDAARSKSALIKSREKDFAALIRLCELLLHQSVLVRTYSQNAQRKLSETVRWAGDRCSAIAQAVQSGNPVAPPQDRPHPEEDSLASAVISTADLAQDILAGRVAPPEDLERASSKGFFRPDAFTNPAYLANALKASAAAFACYFFMAAADWNDIGTAVTTCLITALTTRVQARQKQSLRVGGAAAGGILGLIVIAFVLPSGMGLTGLSVVTAIVTFLGAWVFEGSPRLSYAGVQLVICFFLGVFGENSTPTSLIGMRDRVLGILIGNIAMWLFYDGIQPVWTADSSRKAFAAALVALGKLAGLRIDSQDSQQAARTRLTERKAFLDASSELRAIGDAGNLDLGMSGDRQREQAPQIRRTESKLQQLFSFEFVAAETKLLGLPPIPSGVSTRDLSRHLHSLASLVKGGESIRNPEPVSTKSTTPRDEVLLSRIRTDIAHLFSADNRPA